MIAIAGILGALGLVSLLSRKSFLGMLVGIQLLVLGAASAFVIAGIQSHNLVDGPIFAFVIVLSGATQLAGGYALLMRFYYLKASVEMKEMESLKQ
jgi:NADH:ubiquinone oxidoreductase subunit K